MVCAKYGPEGEKFMSCTTGANGKSNLIDHAEQEKHTEANRDSKIGRGEY